MALLTSEIQACKAELGYNLLTIGAAAYVGVHPMFEEVIASHLQAGAATTSTTVVTAASTPTPSTITLVSATGFASGATIIVDVDDRQERVTLQNLSGTSATALFTKAHTGTYPVVVEGGEAIVRRMLARLRSIGDTIGSADTFGTAGLKSLDKADIVWQDTNGTSVTTTLGQLKAWQMHLRDELAAVLGVVNLWRERRASGSSMSLY